MNPNDDEQTRILRGMWVQLKDLGETLGGKIDATNERLDQTNQRIEAMDQRLTGRIDETNRRLKAMDERLTGRIDETNRRLEAMDERLTGRIDETNQRLDETNQRLDETNQRLDVIHREARAGRTATQHGFERVLQQSARHYQSLDDRLVRVERHVGLRDD